jgi:hypothetical protein
MDEPETSIAVTHEPAATFTAKHTAIVALCAVIAGALLGGIAQGVVEWMKERHEAAQYRAQRADEIMTLVAGSQWLYVTALKMAETDPVNMPPPPSDPDRVYALVTLNFPRISPSAKAFEVACWNHFVAIEEMAIQKKNGLPVNASQEAETWKKLYEARETLMRDLSSEIGVIVTKRPSSP